ncbi:TRAP transporter substrate-binding protein [Bacillus sp. B15-48]|uniref:TRAP transporter substrate-binding protein n=1 Tax=Bacillus sp. B15-48 TaxID=1548601 RepID=UPI00193F12B7|nr:TRAP transporter substrate-binding protein [Bacillus sp. B15-48]MBM4763363.1 hypothetical protein [Bacillus sp. B15-48]
MKKIKLSLFLILALVLAACGNTTSTHGGESNQGNNSNNTNGSESSGDEKYVLTMTHGYGPDSSHDNIVEWYADEVEKRSNGRLVIDIYPNGQLVPIDQEVSGVLQGQVDMSHTSSPNLASFDPIWNFFELPFTFDYKPEDPSYYLEQRSQFINDENGGQWFAKNMEGKGLTVLGIAYTDIFGSVFTNDDSKLLSSQDNAKTLRVRSPGGIITPETIQALGGSSMTISGTEAITALQQGVIDGMLTVPMYAHESQLPVKTYTVAPMFNPVTTILIKTEKFHSLPEDLQQLLIDTGKDYEQNAKEMIINNLPTVLEKLESEMGVEIYYPTDEEIAAMREAVEPVWEFFEKEVDGGKEIMDSLSTFNPTQ